MRVRIRCNETDVPLGPFVTRFVGNVCTAIAASLRGPVPAKSIGFEIRPDSVGFCVDGVDVSLDRAQGFAATLVRSTLEGVTGRLKGVEETGVVRIDVELG